jgi:hypothetical protein
MSINLLSPLVYVVSQLRLSLLKVSKTLIKWENQWWWRSATPGADSNRLLVVHGTDTGLRNLCVCMQSRTYILCGNLLLHPPVPTSKTNPILLLLTTSHPPGEWAGHPTLSGKSMNAAAMVLPDQNQ